MAFGFHPKFETDFKIENCTLDEFRSIVQEIYKRNGWQTLSFFNDKIVIEVPKSFSSNGETITILLENNSAFIKSESKGFQLSDWRKNKKNIEDFFITFNDIVDNYSIEEI